MPTPDSGDLPLLRRIPGLAVMAPRVALARLPTPVERIFLETGGEARGETREVLVKRDDLSADAYGGNKVRKLEFLLGEAGRRRAGRLVTAGALGSHHGLATVVYSRRLGLPVTLVLYPQPLTAHVRAVLRADHALGAELRLVRRMALVPAGLLRERIRYRRERPFVVAPGGSDAVGTLGYVNAALELVEQVEGGLAPRPDVVHVACGTMGTAAGLALGFALAGVPIRVHAVRVTSRIVTNRALLRWLLGATARLLRAAADAGGAVAEVPEGRDLASAALRRITLRHEQLGEGYGRATERGRRAAERFDSAGLSLDPTYTSKAAAGLLATLKPADEGVHLYWHTLSDRMPTAEVREAGADSREIADIPEEFQPFL